MRRVESDRVSDPVPSQELLKVTPARLNALLPPLKNVIFIVIPVVEVPARPVTVTSGVQLGSRGTVLMSATVI